MRYKCQNPECDALVNEEERLQITSSTGRQLFKCPHCRGRLKQISPKCKICHGTGIYSSGDPERSTNSYCPRHSKDN